MKVNVKKLNENAIIPTRGSEYAAGMDLYACIDSPIIITPHNTVSIPTGIATELPHGYFGAIFARSGLARNYGLRPGTAVSVIDEDYRGEWIVPLHNDFDEPKMIGPNERIAQLVIMPYMNVEFNEVSSLDSTSRGEGGFGSSGK